MNYSAIFTLSARAEQAYTAAQTFISDECPLLEERLKTTALTAAINVFEFALLVIDWVTDESEKAPEYALKFRITQIETKRFVIRQLIKIVQLDGHCQISATARKAWTCKGAIAQSTLDKVFCLN